MSASSDLHSSDYLTGHISSRLDALFVRFADDLLSNSREAISKRTLQRGKLSRDAFVEPLLNDAALPEAVSGAVISLESEIERHELAIRNLRRGKESGVSSLISKNEEKRDVLLTKKAALLREQEAYLRSEKIFAFVHPVRLPHEDVFRIVLPTPSNRINKTNTLEHLLYGTIYTELLKDGQLCDSPQDIRPTCTTFPSGLSYGSIDIALAIDEFSTEVTTYIASFLESLINDSNHPLRVNESIRRANPLFEHDAFALKIIASPTSYDQYVEKARELLSSASKMDGPQTLAVLQLLQERMTSLSLDEGRALVQDLQRIYAPQEKDIEERVLSDIDSSFMADLNLLAGEEMSYGETPSFERVAVAGKSGTVTIEGVECVPLELASRLRQIKEEVFARGYEEGTFRKIQQGGKDYISLSDFLASADKIVTTGGRSLHFFPEPVMKITEFCDLFGMQHQVLKSLIKDGEIKEGIHIRKRRDGIIAGYFVSKERAEEVREAYSRLTS